MMQDGVIVPELAEAALRIKIQPGIEAPVLVAPDFIELKAQNQIRSGLLSQLGVNQLYELDRYDLTVKTSIDMVMQRVATQALRRMLDPAYVRDAGFAEPPLLHRGDPSRVIYSFTLSERTSEGNRIRIQTDNFNGPFNINERSRIELGSTAKLRTLVTYLEIVEQIHKDLSSLPPNSLEALAVSPQDQLGNWARKYILDHPGAGLKEILLAAMERRYSAGPRERFATGGGIQVFSNFDSMWDHRILTVSEGFQQSVNLIWIRVMRDIVKHFMYGSPASTSRILEDINHPARREYLARFADQEGGVFVDRFYRKYSSLSADSIRNAMVVGRRLNPTRMAWAFRTIMPLASPEELRRFLMANAFETRLTEGAAADLYGRTIPEGQTLADLGYLASIHPLELWVVRYILEHPNATRAEVMDASRPLRQEVYGWLFRTSRRNAQDVRIRSILKMEAFSGILQSWKRLGYPFDNIVPSLGTSIGSSGDRPAALAELIGIILNGGVRLPVFRIERLQFAKGTPYEVNLERRPQEGIRILSAEVAEVAREALRQVVETGTGRRIRGALIDGTGAVVSIGGKTGTGDNRYRVFAPGGRMVESRPVNRTSTFVFFLGDRYFGVITAYVPGPEAGEFGFTSSLPLEILRRMLPELGLFNRDSSNQIQPL
jgi:membrane peptidoglycan carboxypeptidase